MTKYNLVYLLYITFKCDIELHTRFKIIINKHQITDIKKNQLQSTANISV